MIVGIEVARQRADDWRDSGSKRLGDRLREKTITIMDKHQPDLLPTSICEEIQYILKSFRK